jgi:hypothetical protein
MSTMARTGCRRAITMMAKIVTKHGRWYGIWCDDHEEAGHRIIGPCASEEMAQERTRSDIRCHLGTHVCVIIGMVH